MLRLLNRLTLTRQWVLATLLAILPLVIAVLYAAQYLAMQAQTQRQMVASIGRLNEMDNTVNAQISSIERSARQYLLLRLASTGSNDWLTNAPHPVRGVRHIAAFVPVFKTL